MFSEKKIGLFVYLQERVKVPGQSFVGRVKLEAAPLPTMFGPVVVVGFVTIGSFSS